MTSSFPWNSVYDLEEIKFNNGETQQLSFNVFDSGSVALNLNSCTLLWEMTRYGGSQVLLTKTPAYSGTPNNQMIVTLASSDTSGSTGKFVQFFTVTTVGGVVYKPSRGLIDIL